MPKADLNDQFKRELIHAIARNMPYNHHVVEAVYEHTQSIDETIYVLRHAVTQGVSGPSLIKLSEAATEARAHGSRLKEMISEKSLR